MSAPIQISLEPLTPERFGPFGEVVQAPDAPGRQYCELAAQHLLPEARLKSWCAQVAKAAHLPRSVTKMERHEFSSQTFIPLQDVQWIVVVAPKNAEGLPDMAKARAFQPGPGQGVTYRPDTWHASLSVLTLPASFAVSQWMTGDERDEEFVDVPEVIVQ